MRSSQSLPSLFTQSKLFGNSNQLQQTKKELKDKYSLNSQKSLDSKRLSRPLIHFSDKNQGFTTFKSINESNVNEILQSLKGMKSKSTHIDKTIKAEIMFNKNQLSKMAVYYQQKKKTQKKDLLNELAKRQPIQMKKEIKKTQKFKKKIKTTVAVKFEINYLVYQHSRLSWKPFVDFDSMPVCVGTKVYFIGGRTITNLGYYDRYEDKWFKTQITEGLKPFGETQGTICGKNQLVFFGGAKFFIMGDIQLTNQLTYINLQTNKSYIEEFQPAKIVPRSFHAQCIYGDLLIVSGGIDKKNKLINNFMAFHLKKKYWFELTIAKIHPKLLEGFSKHKMMPIVHRRKKYNIYEEQPVICDSAQKSQILQEGIYIFGGQDQNVQLMNRVFILKVGLPSIEVYEPTIKGKPPLTRKNFGWTRMRQFLFIQGGRNDQYNPFVLNSMHVLNLKIMTWINIKGDLPTYRHGHVLLNDQHHQIVIVGGKSMEGLSKQIYPLSFDQIFEYI